MDLLRGLDATNLGNNILGTILGHQLRKLLALIVALDILKTECHLGGAKQRGAVLTLLSKFNGRTDEAFLAAELTERRTANTLDSVLQMGVANAADDLGGIFALRILVDAVLADDQVASFLEGLANLGHDGLVLKSIVNGALAAVVSVVGGSSVTSVDSVQLALDEGSELINPVDTINAGDLLEGSALNNPLVKLLERHIQAGVGILCRDNAVNGRVGEASALVVILQAVGSSIARLLDVLSKGVGRANGVFAGNDRDGGQVVGSLVDTLGDDRGDEFQDIRTDRTRDNISSGNLLDQVGLVSS